MGRIVGITYPKPADTKQEQTSINTTEDTSADIGAVPEQEKPEPISEEPQLPADEPEEMPEEPEEKTSAKRAGRR